MTGGGTKVDVAVCGVGFVGGQAHAPAFKKIPCSNLVALNARTETRVKKLAEKYYVKNYPPNPNQVKI